MGGVEGGELCGWKLLLNLVKSMKAFFLSFFSRNEELKRPQEYLLTADPWRVTPPLHHATEKAHSAHSCLP